MNAGFWALGGAVIGAFLGFGGTYLIQRLAERRQKKRLCTIARNVIGLEILHNLEILEQIEKNISKAIEEKYSIYTYSQPPRTEVFNRIFDLPSLSVLDNIEQMFFIHTFGTLNMVFREYALWPDKMRQLQHDSTEQKRASSQWLLAAITMLGSDLIKLLCKVCLKEKEGLQREDLKNIYAKLKKTENKDETYGVYFKSSDDKWYKQKTEDKKCKYLVVWEHDYPECPLEVIELRPSKEAK